MQGGADTGPLLPTVSRRPAVLQDRMMAAILARRIGEGTLAAARRAPFPQQFLGLVVGHTSLIGISFWADIQFVSFHISCQTMFTLCGICVQGAAPCPFKRAPMSGCRAAWRGVLDPDLERRLVARALLLAGSPDAAATAALVPDTQALQVRRRKTKRSCTLAAIIKAGRRGGFPVTSFVK